MEVTLIGMGLGDPTTLTAQAVRALEGADGLIGARRLVEGLNLGREVPRYPATKGTGILEILRRSGLERPCVLYSGDTGFYSGARSLTALLEKEGIPFRVLPGLSSVQYLAARLGRPWQDWKLVSAHGTRCDPVAAVLEGREAFFLTGGELGPGELCQALRDAGLGHLWAVVGEELSYPAERITRGTAAEFAQGTFAPLSVLLVEGAERPRAAVSSGIPDEDFLRDEVPMTKREVRAAALSLLEVEEEDVLWDVGAGTGSVSVELALLARRGRVYAVERKGEALSLICANRTRFGAWNLVPVRGTAPAALEDLPAPDGVFVGGSGGELDAILAAALGKNPRVRLCVSAIALETLSAAAAAFAARGLEAQVTQIWAARSKEAGGLNLMMGQNPVWLISGRRREEEA